MNIPLLFSYHYINKSAALKKMVDKILQDQSADVIIDSGAFSAHRLGKPIDLEEYCAYCLSIAPYPTLWGTVMLDVIGNAELSKVNLKKQIELGVKPMPVLTADLPPERAIDMYAVNNRFCVAGALGQFSGHMEWVCNRYVNCVRACPPDAQIHGLGFVRWPQMYQCGLTTVDSSSWTGGSRWATLNIFSREHGLVTCPQYKRIRELPPHKAPPEYIKLLRDCGITQEDFLDEKLMTSGHKSFVFLATAYAAVSMSYFSRTKKLAQYLAVTSMDNMIAVYLVMRHGRLDGMSLDFHAARKESEHIKALSEDERIEYVAHNFALLNKKGKAK